MLKLFNTLSRSVEEFTDPEKPVTIYTCGPTVYSYQHIGNFASAVYWDLLIRTLIAEGFQVKRVLNLTDVGHLSSDADEGEDKLEKGARLERKTVWQVAEFYADDYLRHFRGLGLLEPDLISKATDYIEADLNLIQQLIDRGYAYLTSDGIYYDTSKFPTYADFARLDLAGLAAGARVDFNQEKRNVTDFALWKFILPDKTHAMRWETAFNAPDKAAWNGPLGVGYPGWHIECASIILSELGETIDIHTGGIEHIPVHHTNEIAEAEAVTGRPLARFWLHNNHVMVDGQKISKSLGNVVLTVDFLERGYTYDEFKFWVYHGHYQKERNFTWDELDAAKNRLARWRRSACLRHQAETTTAPDKIFGALSDNLSSAQLLSDIDRFLEQNSPDEAFWLELDRHLGLHLVDESAGLNGEENTLFVAYQTARAAKDYAKSDTLRAQLIELGVRLADGPDRTIWYR